MRASARLLDDVRPSWSTAESTHGPFRRHDFIPCARVRGYSGCTATKMFTSHPFIRIWVQAHSHAQTLAATNAANQPYIYYKTFKASRFAAAVAAVAARYLLCRAFSSLSSACICFVFIFIVRHTCYVWHGLFARVAMTSAHDTFRFSPRYFGPVFGSTYSFFLFFC